MILHIYMYIYIYIYISVIYISTDNIYNNILQRAYNTHTHTHTYIQAKFAFNPRPGPKDAPHEPGGLPEGDILVLVYARSRAGRKKAKGFFARFSSLILDSALPVPAPGTIYC